LINLSQRDEAMANIQRLESEARKVTVAELPDAGPEAAFVAPTLLFSDAPGDARAVHEIEVFGPCASVLPYDTVDDAAVLGARGGGSLALSLFSNDPAVQAQVVDRLGPWHGRVLIVDEAVGKAHTGHAIVMPQCVHGGPGRAGGGEELGGLRGLRFHMQRAAVQGAPQALDAVVADAVEQAL
jgi:3,4-dehydroadipyl-CoA semialdehyde dehydrogenase